MTIEQKYIDLINAEIDGAISDSDRAALHTFLQQDAEGKALHGELTSLSSLLESVAAVEPPPQLSHLIMSSVKPARPASASPGLLSALFRMPALTHAATFAAGVFLALSLLNSGQVSNRAFDDVTGLVGTVAAPVDASSLRKVAIDNPAIAGTVSLRKSGLMLILDFDLTTTRPIEIEADYTDKTIWFNGFAQLPESSSTIISADSGRVRLTAQGKRRFAVYLHNEGGRRTTVKLRFLADGQLLHEAGLDYVPVTTGPAK